MCLLNSTVSPRLPVGFNLSSNLKCYQSFLLPSLGHIFVTPLIKAFLRKQLYNMIHESNVNEIVGSVIKNE